MSNPCPETPHRSSAPLQLQRPLTAEAPPYSYSINLQLQHPIIAPAPPHSSGTFLFRHTLQLHCPLQLQHPLQLWPPLTAPALTYSSSTPLQLWHPLTAPASPYSSGTPSQLWCPLQLRHLLIPAPPTAPAPLTVLPALNIISLLRMNL